MNRYFGVWKYLLLLLMVSLTIFVITVIYKSHGMNLPPVLADINSGVIGALLTAIVTLILVTDQTEKVNLSNKSSTVFQQKLEIFNTFLSVLNDSLKDGDLRKEEILSIMFHFAKLRMHVSEQNAERIADHLSRIDSAFFHLDENDVPNFEGYQEVYNGICAVLKSELYGTRYAQMRTFDLANASQISFTPRLSHFDTPTFDEWIAYLDGHREFFITKKQIRFEITEDILARLQEAYGLVADYCREQGLAPDYVYRIYTVRVNDVLLTRSASVEMRLEGPGEHYLRIFISEKKRVNAKIIGKLENVPMVQWFCVFESMEEAYKLRRVLDYFKSLKGGGE